MRIDGSRRNSGLGIRRWLRLGALALLVLPVAVACNLSTVIEAGLIGGYDSAHQAAVEEMQDPADSNGSPITEPGQEQGEIPPIQGALDSLSGKVQPGSALPSEGRLIAECQDSGVVAWDQESCAYWGHKIDVVVDFETRTFSVEEHSFCESSAAGLFAKSHILTSTETWLRGEVLEDGRLFGRTTPNATQSTWVEGEADRDTEPLSTVELMVVGFVNAKGPFIGLGMCTEDSIVGGAEAMLASGWRQDLNPCSGGAEWAIMCDVVRTEETLK